MHHDLSALDEILARYPREEASLVMVLQDVQAHFRYLPCEALERVARELRLPPTRVFSVATFYKAFSLSPQGRHAVEVCKGTACHVRGAQLLEDELCRQLRVAPGATTADGDFTLRTVNCVGACAMAPVVVVDGKYHGETKPAQIERLLRRARKAEGKEAEAAPETARLAPPRRLRSPADLRDRVAIATRHARGLASEVRVCGGTGCLAAGGTQVLTALQRAAGSAGVPLALRLESCMHGGERLLGLTGCRGRCQQGVLVHVTPGDLLYLRVKPSDADEIVAALAGGTRVERLLDAEPVRGAHLQVLRALACCGRVDPESLEDYLAQGGFLALATALESEGRTPEQVVAAVESSGLRGRGGAGFQTGRKWRSALAAAARSGQRPYVLCNGDEGDPGAFMDRAIMEGSPFQVLEGMILGAFALGGRQGTIYARNEYPLAIARLQNAIETLHAAGLLGEHILGTELSFDVRISRGGGAFVCGESTALMRSIEGKVGEPRAKYTRSVERGLHDRPTVLNNVETWSLVPGIVRHGPEWLSSLGTARSKGTKVFSLVGQVAHTGLVEVPMGTTLRQLIYEVGGGVLGGRAFKAVQSGGPSGGCLPQSALDLPIDFEALTEAGSMMGSGGMIVMDDRTCMVDVARYFVDFLLQESCGKCAPCRLGLPQLSFLLGKITRGQGTAKDLTAIEEIASGMLENALCGLGKSAPNPVLSTLRYFRDEYEEHLRGRCPAGVCKSLIRYRIDETCTGCLLCIKPCPADAITGQRGVRHVIDLERCTKCGICRSVCQYDAISVASDGGVA
jgi:NADH:ubiquinone oxidoreductase subunit F (NADH-binding)/NADH:ubiquinone oxidoreductase subunit E/Pyruvate/2-oxoacid:ferredoxin oxidoreductase delta subunit